jgi:hypothetical protein
MGQADTIKELELLKEELLKRVNEIENTINTFKSMSTKVVTNNKVDNSDINKSQYSDYDNNSTYRKKVACILKNEGRFLHVREIAEIISDIEKGVRPEEVKKKVSSAIAYFARTNQIVKLKIGTSNINSFWGKDIWLDEKNNPKSGRELNESYLSNQDSANIDI